MKSSLSILRDRNPNLIFSILPLPICYIQLNSTPFNQASTMPTATATLRASLEKHNNTFESLLRLIPAQYYIVNEEAEEQVSSSLKTHTRTPSTASVRPLQNTRSTARNKKHLNKP